ncbi:MAG: 16S rRNA (adenine(1518)-N(6)/adenine(1519)-N(6))-dimethyltransferase RsmA [Chloroflexota bacterium]
MSASQHPAPSLSHARQRLRVLGRRPRKSLSQSFLDDPEVAAAIVHAARLGSQQDVLEVGPGLGVLTERLAGLARRVVAIEIDPVLADWLRSQVEGSNVNVVTSDVLQSEPARYFQTPFVVVANLPYHVTSPALRHLLNAGPPFASRLVVMVQAEVADRIAARAGELSALAVTIQVQTEVNVVLRVAASAFYPRPKVDSAVMLMEPISESDRIISRAELAAFTKLVQAGFKQPRKRLANSLAEGLGSPKQAAVDLLETAGIDPDLRPQVLTVGDWVRLYRCR